MSGELPSCRRCRGERRSDEMRQMAGRARAASCSAGDMTSTTCAKRLPEICHDRATTSDSVFARRRHNNNAAVKQIGAAVFGTAFFAAGQRMTADKRRLPLASFASNAFDSRSIAFVLPASVMNQPRGAAPRLSATCSSNLRPRACKRRPTPPASPLRECWWSLR